MQRPSEYYGHSLDNQTNNVPASNYNKEYSHVNSVDQDDQTNSSASNSTLQGGASFQRRKNWSERILVEVTGLLHVVSAVGKILYCSETTHEMTGYRPHELVGQP
jgi:hypothetical protein